MKAVITPITMPGTTMATRIKMRIQAMECARDAPCFTAAHQATGCPR